jgi:hypothetical protein
MVSCGSGEVLQPFSPAPSNQGLGRERQRLPVRGEPLGLGLNLRGDGERILPPAQAPRDPDARPGVIDEVLELGAS